MLSSKDEAEWFGAESFESDYDDEDYEREQRRISRAKDDFQCYRCNLWYDTKDEMNDCIKECKEYGAESFEAETFEVFYRLQTKDGRTWLNIGDFKKREDAVEAFNKNIGKSYELRLVEFETMLEYGAPLETVDRLIMSYNRHGNKIQVYEAETTIAKQYGETLDNLDDLQKIVKKTISPKRKPTKFIKDAKSSVVDSWKQMGKDGFRRQMYEPMEFEAEIPKSVKLGFGFGAGLALFQVAVIGSAIGLGMLLNKE